MNKIIRTICYFTDNPTIETLDILDRIASVLVEKGYEIQTKRICSPSIKQTKELDSKFTDDFHCFGVGTLDRIKVLEQLDDLLETKDVSFNIDLTQPQITLADTQILFEIIRKKPGKTFNFTYVFNNPFATPFFPSASYEKNGFSIGLQPTDLAENCQSLEEWLEKLKGAWLEIFDLLREKAEFFGIDSSIAPLYTGKSSFINFIKRLKGNFSQSAATDMYLKITKFMGEENPKPVGLCGIMFPCLEDFELAEEYEKGDFSIERNLFLSLHSGLGIDTYPIGVDERPQRVLEILSLVQKLSNKYKKPLSVRLVSDGKAKIGEKTDFQNQYLKDVVVRKL